MMTRKQFERRAAHIRTGPTLGDLFLEARESGWSVAEIAKTAGSSTSNVYQGLKFARIRRENHE